jgi:Na+-transporting NADH:ubiquinone oxidoreductase subunit F
VARKPREGRAVVTGRRALGPEILEADLALLEPSRLDFDAGQWVSVPLGGKTVRAYSIASPPSLAARITLCADVAPAGPGSRWFSGLAEGREVRFTGPLGGFVFARDDTRRPLFVAEEIGIVPIRSILADLYERGFAPATVLVYWARDPGWLTYDAEFRALARRVATFSYHPVVREAGPEWREPRAAVEEAVDAVVPTVEGLVAYVAGGAATINRVREVLMAKGLERKSVKWEKFYG